MLFSKMLCAFALWWSMTDWHKRQCLHHAWLNLLKAWTDICKRSMKLHFKKFLIILYLLNIWQHRNRFFLRSYVWLWWQQPKSQWGQMCGRELGEQTHHGIYTSPSPPRTLTGRTEIQMPRVFHHHLLLTFILQPASGIEGGRLHILLFTTLL